MAEERSCMQLIKEEGRFRATKFEKFGKKVQMDNWGVSYTVVSIMGPQSGGKSTLLNHLFDTKFEVMDASNRRKQTTQGIWVATSGIESRTLVVDMEGSDSKERGENDNFEKWSALFALAISDIVLINMWCHDLGRDHAASRPLLRTVFQVMPRICSQRKVTLMFVLRDQTRTSLEVLRDQILEDMKEIWNSINSPIVRKGTPLNEFFNVEVEALCNYEEKEDQFKEEVAGLRSKIFEVDRDQGNEVPASSFPSRAKRIWKEIKHTDLNIPCMKETDFNWKRGKTAIALTVAAALSTVGIAGAGLAIPGMQAVAVVMIPVVAGFGSQLLALYRGRAN